MSTLRQKQIEIIIQQFCSITTDQIWKDQTMSLNQVISINRIDYRGTISQISFEINHYNSDMLLNKQNEQKYDLNMHNQTIREQIEFRVNDKQSKCNYNQIAITKRRLVISGLTQQHSNIYKLSYQIQGNITSFDISAIKNSYSASLQQRKIIQKIGIRNAASNISKNSNQLNEFQKMGVKVFLPQNSKNLNWDYLGGYQKQKQQIQDTLLLALKYPNVFTQITHHTRSVIQNNKPRAILFQGPPGTGKTTSAKIIAQQVNIPLIYIPMESIMSKWYGQSQQKLAQIWNMAVSLGKVIIFMDEIDAIATTRNQFMHQASRRILSTLLRKIDSFQSENQLVFICATNRKNDLDAAILSRIDYSIKFNLPTQNERAKIFKRYAKHLNENELQKLAESSYGLSGRNIADLCKSAQRKWASRIIRKQVNQNVPDFNTYFQSLKQKKSE